MSTKLQVKAQYSEFVRGNRVGGGDVRRRRAFARVCDNDAGFKRGVVCEGEVTMDTGRLLMVAELGIPDDPVVLAEGAQVDKYGPGTIDGTDKSRGL